MTPTDTPSPAEQVKRMAEAARHILRDLETSYEPGFDSIHELESALSSCNLTEIVAALEGAREPVAWMYSADREEPFASIKRWPFGVVKAQCWTETPLYAAPPALRSQGGE